MKNGKAASTRRVLVAVASKRLIALADVASIALTVNSPDQNVFQPFVGEWDHKPLTIA
jgi:hypothetical protein